MSDRLYELLPAVYRIRDAGQGYVLKALLAVMERELDVVDDDIARLYRNWFIETCDEWVVPYIGDLLDVRGIQTYGGDSFSLRAYVANTLAYRRRKGTAAVLEQLAHDVTGWPARAVEYFQRLQTTQYINHIRPENHRTPDLRDSAALAFVDGPFDTTAHTADVRHIDNRRGRHNIPNIGIWLWRLQSYSLDGVSPRAHGAGDGRYFFNPLGADLQLFNRPQAESSIADLAAEINQPVPLRRRPLFDDLQALREGICEDSVWLTEPPLLRVTSDGVDIAIDGIHVCDLSDYDSGGGVMDWRRPPASVGDHRTVAIDPRLGRLSFAPGEIPDDLQVAYAYGFSADIGGGPYNRRMTLELWLPRYIKPEVADEDFELWQIGVTRDTALHAAVDSHSPVVGDLAAAIAAWNAHVGETDTPFGIITLLDSATYDEDLSATEHEIAVPAGARLAIVAAAWPDNGQIVDGEPQRPRGRLAPDARRPHILADLQVRGSADSGAQAGELLLDGLLIEGRIRVLSGNLGPLTLYHCTLGASAGGLGQSIDVDTTGGSGDVVNNANLSISLDHCISGPLDLPDSVATLVVADSIIAEDRIVEGHGLTTTTAIEAHGADADIQRSTVYGTVDLRTLSASDCIFTGILTITRRQDGCLRFSYVPPDSRTPRHYRCQPDHALVKRAEPLAVDTLDAPEIAAVTGRVQPDFTSSRYGEPGFSQLSLSCATEITTGGEGDSEMGAFYSLRQPQREANLRGALEEYLRFGLEAGIFHVT
jgi:hypothetical protein